LEDLAIPNYTESIKPIKMLPTKLGTEDEGRIDVIHTNYQ
jgi:hypothetical protein